MARSSRFLCWEDCTTIIGGSLTRWNRFHDVLDSAACLRVLSRCRWQYVVDQCELAWSSVGRSVPCFPPTDLGSQMSAELLLPGLMNLVVWRMMRETPIDRPLRVALGPDLIGETGRARCIVQRLNHPCTVHARKARRFYHNVGCSLFADGQISPIV